MQQRIYLNFEAEQQDRRVKLMMRAMPKTCIRETSKQELLHPTLKRGRRMR